MSTNSEKKSIVVRNARVSSSGSNYNLTNSYTRRNEEAQKLIFTHEIQSNDETHQFATTTTNNNNNNGQGDNLLSPQIIVFNSNRQAENDDDGGENNRFQKRNAISLSCQNLKDQVDDDNRKSTVGKGCQ